MAKTKSKKFKNKPIKNFRDTEFYFYDCPICRAMAKADDKGKSLTMPELKKAFAKANKDKRW